MHHGRVQGHAIIDLVMVVMMEGIETDLDRRGNVVDYGYGSQENEKEEIDVGVPVAPSPQSSPCQT